MFGVDYLEKQYSSRGIILSLAKALLYLAIWFAAQFLVIPVFGALLLASTSGMTPDQQISLIMQYSMELNITVSCVTVLVLALVARLTHSTLSERAYINKMPPRFAFNTIIMGVSGAFAVVLILGLVTMSGIIPEEWVSIQNDTYSDVMVASPLMQLLSVGLVAPVMEEILFRGFILGELKKEMHPWVAIAISSLLFGVVHGTPLGIIYATCLGILLGWLSVKFNSIVPSLLFHMAYNCTQAYSDGISFIAAVIAIPIIVFEIIDINKNFRGKQQ